MYKVMYRYAELWTLINALSMTTQSTQPGYSELYIPHASRPRCMPDDVVSRIVLRCRSRRGCQVEAQVNTYRSYVSESHSSNPSNDVNAATLVSARAPGTHNCHFWKLNECAPPLPWPITCTCIERSAARSP